MADGEPPAGGGGGGVGPSDAGAADANAPPPNKPFSLSFSAPAKPRPAVPVGGQADDNGGVKRELIKGVEGGRVATVAPPTAPARAKAKPVIPKLENTFQARPPGAPPAAVDLTTTAGRFEAAGPETAQADDVTYGLQGRRGGGGVSTSGAGVGAGAPPARDWEASRLKDDLARLPEVAGLDAYAAMPVEDFGTAMLRGMGWKGDDGGGGGGGGNGGGGGGGAATASFPAPPAPRPPRLGLGATAIAAPPSRSRAKPGDPIAAAGGAPGGGAGAGAGPTQAPPPPGVLAPGAGAALVAGPHAGLACTVLALEGGGGSSRRATVRLTASGQTVRVGVRDLEVGGGGGGRGGREEGAPAGGGGGGGAAARGRDRDRGRDRAPPTDAKRARRPTSRSPPPPPPPPPRPPARPWLRPGILVKVIDKAAGRGKLYLRKAAVVDVPAPGLATLALLPADAGAGGGGGGGGLSALTLPPPTDLLPGVRQAQVETAVPRAAGAAVVVVGGAHAGAAGTLLQRSSEGGGVGAVQLASDLTVVRLSFDDFAERAPVGWGWSGRGEEE